MMLPISGDMAAKRLGYYGYLKGSALDRVVDRLGQEDIL
jgi:hypothetical protein